MLKKNDAIEVSVSISRDLKAELEKTRTSLGMDHESFLKTLLASFNHRQDCSKAVSRAMGKVHELLYQAGKNVENELLRVKERALEIPMDATPSPETPAAPSSHEQDADPKLRAENQMLNRQLQETEKAYLRSKDDIQQLQTEVYLTENIHNQAIRTFRLEKEEELADALKTARRDCDNRVKFARAEERIIAGKEMAVLRKQIDSLTDHAARH